MDRAGRDGPVNDLDVLWEEFRSLHCGKATPTPGNFAPDTTAMHAPATDRPLLGYSDLFDKIHGLKNEDCRTALCLSGGGIRSAAFNLGVLQALARLRLLDKFTYLSTVSGGGYIGAWLCAWRRRTNLEMVLTGLIWPDRSADATCPSELPSALANLRGKTSYLAPRMGLLSSDTWTAIVLYLRNLVLNQLILLPLLATLVMLPKIAVIGSYWFFRGTAAEYIPLGIPLLVFVAWIVLAVQRPAWRLEPAPDRRNEEQNTRYKKRIVIAARTGVLLVSLATLVATVTEVAATRSIALTVLPSGITPYLLNGGLVVGLAFLVALTVEFWRPAAAEGTGGVPDPVRHRAGVEMLGGSVVGLCLAWLAPALVGERAPALALGHMLALGALLGGMVGVATAMLRKRELWRSVLRVEQAFVVATLSGVIGAALFWIGSHFAQTADLPIMLTFSLTPLWLAFCYIVADAIFLGFTARRTPDPRQEALDPWGDQEREYLARSGGRILLYAGGLTILCLATFFGPRLWANGAHLFLALVTTVVSFLGSVGIGVSPLVGKKGGQELSSSPWWFPADAIISIATPIFIVILISLVSFAIDRAYPAADMWEPGSALRLLGLGIAFVVISLVAQWGISVNRFSLHDVYRLRLLREFLGASNENHEAKADGWTGFTASDDSPLHELWPPRNDPPQQRKCLYPLINATLNLVKTNRLAWQERKGEPFVFTPAHLGAVRLGYSDTQIAAGGFLLSSAMTLSGAAVSPNSGYTSKPALALLLTMFNLRLGAWVGDPRNPKRTASRGPRFALVPLMAELFGRTTEKGTAGHVFVSDGGHFDNLGIYEVLRRRCRYIVASDAGRDPNYAFEDLGRAVRQAAIDLGIRITFVHLSMPPRPKDGEPPATNAPYAAFAKIEYPEINKTTNERACGWLIYFKPGYQGRDEPADVRAYASQNPTFPHDSTLNQFFGESQFESYRQLGNYLVMRFSEIAGIEPGLDLPGAFEKAKQIAWPDSVKAQVQPRHAVRWSFRVKQPRGQDASITRHAAPRTRRTRL